MHYAILDYILQHRTRGVRKSGLLIAIMQYSLALNQIKSHQGEVRGERISW
jgi:hypothetical protein